MMFINKTTIPSYQKIHELHRLIKE